MAIDGLYCIFVIQVLDTLITVCSSVVLDAVCDKTIQQTGGHRHVKYLADSDRVTDYGDVSGLRATLSISAVSINSANSRQTHTYLIEFLRPHEAHGDV